VQFAVKQTTGPISIAAYMRQCLTSPQGGYYTSSRSRNGAQQADQFGREGDFVTSPEISQVFGEMVGIWFVSEWMAQVQPKNNGRDGKVHLIEFGPGRGTLMDDILRTIKNFTSMAKTIETVYLVEASDELREKQHRMLCGESASLEKTPSGWQSLSQKYFEVSVVWVEDVSLLPGSENSERLSTPFIIAHEFFDALPIHAFESVPPAPASGSTTAAELLDAKGRPIAHSSRASKEPQWREYLVAPTKKSTATNTTASGIAAEPNPDFQLVLAKASTPTSLVLPEISPRYRRLKYQPGSSIEISPESYRYIQDFARRIGGDTISPRSQQRGATPGNTHRAKAVKAPQASGAALIIDYGPSSTVPVNTLRGIRAHRRVSPFVSPGEVDISADVDFTALAEAAINASNGVEVYGPVEQGVWLTQMGIKERAQQLFAAVKDEAKKKEMELGWKRLIEGGPAGMGRIYKALAIVPESGGRRRPVGFGGGVGV
jgi:NADH dehydrogenase [ubiquinone] 1 alpha subcomplex assembly factor 7